MSLHAPDDGNNLDRDKNHSSYNLSSSNDPNNKLKQDKGKEQFTMGGVKKPKFRPVVNKAVSIHKIDRTQVPLVSTSPTPISIKEEPITNKEETNRTATATIKVKEEEKPKEKPEKKRRDTEKNPKQNRANRLQPRFLVSGESKFFATNNSKSSSGAMDAALLASSVKKEMDIDEFNDDHELTAENNGPVRFPYMQDTHLPSTSSTVSWDEDDAQVTPFELLQGVNDGEMLLFALPSFLPIYTKNREYGINEEAYTHVLDTKPHDYVENELMQVQPGKIGKMRVHQSGRITMDINGYIVDMNVSIPLHYQQQVVTIDESNLNILGNVSHRLILTPDIQNFQ